MSVDWTLQPLHEVTENPNEHGLSQLTYVRSWLDRPAHAIHWQDYGVNGGNSIIAQ